MQKVLYSSQMGEYHQYMNPKVLDYLRTGQTETFEGFAEYDLLAFDWYDVAGPGLETPQILIYLDKQDLFLFCENQSAYQKAASLLPTGQDNEKALYLFFVGLLKNDMSHLEQYESEITDAEDAALVSSHPEYLAKIVEYRKELLRLKRYYEQLDAILDNLVANDNELLSQDSLRHFAILGHRTERFHRSVLNLRDYVTQMREAYQAQIDIEQNYLMKIFTVIAAIFLPLTLLVGWYGMNFRNMPELNWPFAYPLVFLLSLLIAVTLILYFKKRKWF